MAAGRSSAVRGTMPASWQRLKSSVWRNRDGSGAPVKPARPGKGPLAMRLRLASGAAMDLTEAGTILGTFQYMAPEQLEGQEADARTDIFAFGALLYEMVTGQTAFQGKSRVSLIASIMEHEPQPIANHQPLAPPARRELLGEIR